MRELPAAADDGRRARHRWRRKVAVLLAAILVVSVTVCMIPAKLFQSNADGSLVEYLADCVRVNLNGGKELKPVVVEELRSELAEHGFEDVLLPESYLPQCKMEKIGYDEDEIRNWVEIFLIDSSVKIDIRIVNWKSSAYMIPMDFEGQAVKIEQLEKNDLPLLVMDMGDNRKIYFEDGLITYTITTGYDMESTIALANELK